MARIVIVIDEQGLDAALQRVQRHQLTGVTARDSLKEYADYWAEIDQDEGTVEEKKSRRSHLAEGYVPKQRVLDGIEANI